MAASSSYEGPDYSPPLIVRSMGSILRLPRKWHTTNFASYFSTEREDQVDYVDGILVAGVIMFSLFLLWAFILIVLKVKGREVGCASGRAFHTEKIDDHHDIQSTDSSEASYSSRENDNMSSSGSSSSSSSNDQERNWKKHDNNNLKSENDIIVNQKEKEECVSAGYSFDDQSDDERSEDYDSQDGWLSTDEPLRIKNAREKRTRACFLVFSLISLLCIPLILIFSFGPMKETTQITDDLIVLTEDFFGQVSASIDTIESAVDSARILVTEIPTNTDEICPFVNAENFEAELGVNLHDLLETVSLEYEDVNALVTEILTTVKNVITRLSNGINGFEQSVDKTETFLWVIPGVLFAVSLLVTISALGVMLAWKNKSGARIQTFLSYGVLPFLILATTACWIIAITASFGTMTSSDFCTAGDRMGSPDDTIQDILSIFDNAQNNTVYKLVNSYTNRCNGPNPVEDIDEIEILVQTTVDVIWRQLSIVDKIGRANLIEQCGGGAKLADMFTGARNLAKLLTTIRKSLGSASTSLECERMNPIYTQIAHVSLCTDAASASAYGFLFFVILGVSTMTLISLRASWLKNVEEEKVYHDENEIAENMILDEHEEYLAYISRYKHEWQEYHGFDAPTSVAQSNSLSYIDDGSGTIYFEDVSSQEESESDHDSYESPKKPDDGSDMSSTGSKGYGGLAKQIHSPFHTTRSRSLSDNDDRVIAIDEISFPSLSVRQSEDSIGVSIREEEFFAGPSSLLSSGGTADFAETTPDEILVPSTEIVLKDSRKKNTEESSIPSQRRVEPSLQLTIDPEGSPMSQERPDTPASQAVQPPSKTSSWAEGEGTLRKKIMDAAKEVVRKTASEVDHYVPALSRRSFNSEGAAARPNIGSTRTASRLFGQEKTSTSQSIIGNGEIDLVEL